MRQSDNVPRWYFVDESGDTSFYAKRSKSLIVGQDGCSKTLLLGFVRTRDPQELLSKLAEVRLAIATDRYLKDIPSVKESLVFFHAKDDCPEVRKMVFEAIEKMSFAAQVIVGRKIESVFKKCHSCSANKFYDDMVTRLFFGQLHRSNENHIVFAQRGNRTRQALLRAAVEKSVSRFFKKEKPNEHRVLVNTSRPIQEPALQVIDYVNWAVQRAFEKGEMRYAEFIRQKIEVIRDIYDIEKKNKGESCNYDRKKNLFDIKTASPLG